MSKRILFTSDAKFSVQRYDVATAGKIATLSGYAIVWNVLSSDRGGYKVKLLPGSASFAPATFALYHHDYTKPLARADNGTLRITPDDYGVKVEIDLPDTSTGRDTATEVASGLVRGMSFAMLPGGTYTEAKEDGQPVQSFSAFEVDEVTITAVPAFEATSIGVAGESETAQSLADYVKGTRFETLRNLQTALAEEISKEIPADEKEQSAEWSKLETYKVQLYALTLAEIQQNGGKMTTD